MSVGVNIELGYEFTVKAPIGEVFTLLADVPKSVSHFPKVDKLVDLGGGAYRWEMQKVGTEQVNLRTVYACKYVSDPKAHTVTWTPIEDVGNAQVSGRWKLVSRKGHTAIAFETSGTVEVALPALMKVIVVPVVRGEFEGLVEKYIDNLIRTFGGEVD